MILDLKDKIKTALRVIGGQDKYFAIQDGKKGIWIGDRYAGFYIDPKPIGTRSIVYSFGIGTNISFDLELIRRFGCQVFAFDPTPKSIDWLKRQSLPNEFSYFDYGISRETGLAKFFLPANPEHVSGSKFLDSNDDFMTVKMKSFADICQSLKNKKLEILKLDVEGSEYEILDSILNSNIVINQILIEFHHRIKGNNFGIEDTEIAINKLNEFGYKLMGVSACNEEFSFIKE